MESFIRKLSIGRDFPDGALHYQCGKTLKLNNNYYEISLIREISKTPETREFEIYLKHDGASVLWKVISGVPVVVELNIEFD